MACTNHPQVTSGLAPCTACGSSFCPDCLLEDAGRFVCASCKARAMALAEPEPGLPPPRKPNVPAEDVPPWEKRAELGWWNALWKTAWEVISDPTGFFRRMDKSVDCYDALFLYPIFATVIAGIGLVMQMVGLGALFAFAQQQSGTGGGQGIGPMLAAQGGMGCFGVVLAPIFAVIEMAIWAGAMHLGVVVMKTNKRSFGQTLRGCAYAYLPYGVMGLVPILGQFVGFIWTVVAQVAMVREVHGTTTGKAVVAVLWHMVLCCCLIGGGAAVFAALVAQNQ